MKRPADQAKLLFLYLLRSSAEALATQNPATGSSKVASSAAAAAAASRSAPSLDGHINLRLARRADVPSIQRCNLATLPENYNANFYANHMKLFPELALVAEHIPSGCDTSSGGGGKLFGKYDPSPTTPRTPEIIGYVLGKVDEKPVQYPPREFLYPPSTVPGLDDDEEESLLAHMIESQRIPRTETLGHVTSLAVLSDYRRRGLAATLMNQLHQHMRECYGADAVGLHVRVSNRAATRLYCEGMGYEVADVIPQYYQDGEDAYFMKKIFEEEEDVIIDVDSDNEFDSVSTNGNGQRAWGGKVRRGLSNLRLTINRGDGVLPARSSGKAVWETGPLQFRLPRTVVDFAEEDDDTASSSSQSSSSSSLQEEEVYEEQHQVISGNL